MTITQRPLLKILIVENTVEEHYLIQELLTVDTYNRYEFACATSGRMGLLAAEEQFFDCVLVSSRLVDMSGIEFFSSLKSISEANSSTVILLGHQTEEEPALKVTEAGFQDYIVKDSSMTSWVLSRSITKAIDNSKLQALVNQLSEALKAREVFLSIAAHELKTPLTVAKMKFQMGVRQIENNDVQGLNLESLIECYKDGDRQISRLNRIVDNLLDLTRLESDKLSLHLSEFDLVELIHEVADRFMPQFKFSNCTPTFDLPASLIGVWDADRLDQVMTNLMTNILRYACGEPFSIMAKPIGEMVMITIEDKGPGIPIKDQERVFSRFERSEDKRNHQGIGLGLFITRGIIESHNGSIEIDPGYTSGSRMIIKLPLKCS